LNVQKSGVIPVAFPRVKQRIVNNGFDEVTLLHKDAHEQFTAEPRGKVQLSWLVGSADSQPARSDASAPFLLRNPASALQVSVFASTFLLLTYGQELAATLEFSFSTRI